jgi:hypothetical protein
VRRKSSARTPLPTPHQAQNHRFGDEETKITIRADGLLQIPKSLHSGSAAATVPPAILTTAEVDNSDSRIGFAHFSWNNFTMDFSVAEGDSVPLPAM